MSVLYIPFNITVFSDIITPLKKRRLARESLSLDQPATSTPSIMSAVQSNDSTLADGVPTVAEIQDLQNKNGFTPVMPLTPITPSDCSEHVRTLGGFLVVFLWSEGSIKVIKNVSIT